MIREDDDLQLQKHIPILTKDEFLDYVAEVGNADLKNKALELDFDELTSLVVTDFENKKNLDAETMSVLDELALILAYYENGLIDIFFIEELGIYYVIWN